MTRKRAKRKDAREARRANAPDAFESWVSMRAEYYANLSDKYHPALPDHRFLRGLVNELWTVEEKYRAFKRKKGRRK